LSDINQQHLKNYCWKLA